MKIITDGRCTEYVRAGHPERPQRISRTVEKLREQKDLVIEWADPLPTAEKVLLRAHSPEHLAHVKCPRSVDFVDQLPRLPTGKLYKKPLREKYWAGHGRSRLV